MPFSSKKQESFFFANQGSKGQRKFPAGTAEKWARETPNQKSLPNRISDKRKTSSGQSTSRGGTTRSTTPTPKPSNNIAAPAMKGIARKLPDFTANLGARKTAATRNSSAPRPLTLPRSAGNRYARHGVIRSATRGYGRNF